MKTNDKLKKPRSKTIDHIVLHFANENSCAINMSDIKNLAFCGISTETVAFKDVIHERKTAHTIRIVLDKNWEDRIKTVFSYTKLSEYIKTEKVTFITVSYDFEGKHTNDIYTTESYGSLCQQRALIDEEDGNTILCFQNYV